jgi:hypothetical protein
MYKMICIPRRRPRRHLASTRYTFICIPQVAAVVACMQHHTCISTRVHVRTSYICIYVPAGRTRGATIATVSRSVLRTERAQQHRRNGTCTPYIQRKTENTQPHIYVCVCACFAMYEPNGTERKTSTTTTERQQRSGSCTTDHAGDIRRRRHNGKATRGPATRIPASTTTCTQRGVGGTRVRATV